MLATLVALALGSCAGVLLAFDPLIHAIGVWAMHELMSVLPNADATVFGASGIVVVLVAVIGWLVAADWKVRKFVLRHDSGRMPRVSVALDR
jgi:hypothetical protein